MEWKGLVSGGLFGLFITVFATFGLVSVAAEFLGRLLASPGILLSTITIQSLALLFLTNIVLYAGIGHTLERYFGEKILVKVFGTAVIVLIVTILIEAIVFGLSA